MSFVMIVVVWSLTMFGITDSSFGPDVSTTEQTQPYVLRVLLLLQRIIGYLSMNDMHKFYHAVTILDAPIAQILRKDMLNKVKDYGFLNDVKLDLNLFDLNPGLFPIDMYPFACLELVVDVEQPANHIPPWQGVMVANSVCEECLRYMRFEVPDLHEGSIQGEVGLSWGYYEPRLRLMLNLEFEVSDDDFLEVMLASHGGFHYQQTLTAETLRELWNLQKNGRYEWLSVRFPVISNMEGTPFMFRIRDNLHEPLLTLDMLEMRLTNGNALIRHFSLSTVHIDSRGDALVSFQYGRVDEDEEDESGDESEDESEDEDEAED